MTKLITTVVVAALAAGLIAMSVYAAGLRGREASLRREANLAAHCLYGQAAQPAAACMDAALTTESIAAGN